MGVLEEEEGGGGGLGLVAKQAVKFPASLHNNTLAHGTVTTPHSDLINTIST